jgi:hypothetical protein
MNPLPEEKLVLLLPKRSISVLRGIIARHVQEAQIDLDRGIRSEDQSLISASEAVLRCLDPITKELELTKEHI